jgi:hypothetical protein
LEGNPSVKLAARIGYTFKVDPIAILDAGQFEWLVRLASFSVIQSDKEEEARDAKG